MMKLSKLDTALMIKDIVGSTGLEKNIQNIILEFMLEVESTTIF